MVNPEAIKGDVESYGDEWQDLTTQKFMEGASREADELEQIDDNDLLVHIDNLEQDLSDPTLTEEDKERLMGEYKKVMAEAEARGLTEEMVDNKE